jgi:pimeloyl-ACP methyl ester carboxylesterase
MTSVGARDEACPERLAQSSLWLQTGTSGIRRLKTIPSWAVVGTADHAIPLALQLAMANTAHAHITRVDAPHLAMISNPGTVTNVILRAVRATS